MTKRTRLRFLCRALCVGLLVTGALTLFAAEPPPADSTAAPAHQAATESKDPAPDRPPPAAQGASTFWDRVAMTVLLPLSFLLMLTRRTLRHRRAGIVRETPPPLPLHCCVVCGRTDQSHPELDFRVGADGQDYCNAHSHAVAPRVAG